MTDDTPIDASSFVYGLKIADIGDARVKRGKSRRPFATCRHMHLTYDDQERRVWCDDCEKEVLGFDAFKVLVGQYVSAWESIERRLNQVKAAEKHALTSRAAKVIDVEWRKLKTAPTCPHCGDAILPEDVVGGLGMVSKELVRAKRARKADSGSEG